MEFLLYNHSTSIRQSLEVDADPITITVTTGDLEVGTINAGATA